LLSLGPTPIDNEAQGARGVAARKSVGAWGGEGLQREKSGGIVGD